MSSVTGSIACSIVVIGALDNNEPAHWVAVHRFRPDDLTGRPINQLYWSLSVGRLMGLIVTVVARFHHCDRINGHNNAEQRAERTTLV
ncbi:Hypothetical predicted protein [Scomber scombrus]|uniref:Uncharacterized protein n=1 Tax=Scomber scombrus TaxID=13677 RepID=A0AAV1PSY1_SCOSC